MLYDSLTQSPICGLHQSSKLKKNTTFRKPVLLSFSIEGEPNLVDPFDRTTLSHWVP